MVNKNLNVFFNKFQIDYFVLGQTRSSSILQAQGQCLRSHQPVAIQIKANSKFNCTKEIYFLTKLKNQQHIIHLLYFSFMPNHLTFIVCEQFGDMNLRRFLNITPNLSEHQVHFLFTQILNAVNTCKQFNIFHTAINYHNILIRLSNQTIKLINFKSAQIFQENKKYTTPLRDTSFSFSPEYIKSKLYTANSLTIWNLGILLFYMFYKKMPFKSIHNTLYSPAVLYAKNHLSLDAKLFVGWCLTKKMKNRLTIKESLHHPWITKIVS